MEKPKKALSNGQMCSILCGDPLFEKFIKEWVLRSTEIDVEHMTAKEVVYWLFELKSRSELNAGGNAASWKRIYKQFLRWKDGF